MKGEKGESGSSNGVSNNLKQFRSSYISFLSRAEAKRGTKVKEVPMENRVHREEMEIQDRPVHQDVSPMRL